MAEIGLDGASVVAVVGKLIAAKMAQLVAVNEEREAGGLASPRNHALISGYGQRRAALRDKDVWGRGVTDLDGCSSPAPADIAEGSAGKS